MPWTRRTDIRALLVALVLALLATACGGSGGTSSGGAGDASSGEGLVVVATTDFLADLVTQIAGDAAEVTALVPPGVDPHRFSASTRDAGRLREADLVVANGLGLESQLSDTLEAAEEDGIPVLHVAEELDPLPTGGHAAEEQHGDGDGHDEHAHEDDEHDEEEEGTAGEHEAGGDGHGHGAFDPHVWLDPLRMADGAGIVAARLAEVEGPGGLTDEEWRQRGDAYAAELRAAHEDIASIVTTLPEERRELVLDHDSMRYFAERYGFEIVGTFVLGTSTEAQPSTRAIADLAHLVEERRIPAVFVDSTGESQQLARTLVEEAGDDVEIIEVYTGGLGPEGSGAETLIDMLRTNARRIVEGLG